METKLYKKVDLLLNINSVNENSIEQEIRFVTNYMSKK